MKVEREFIDEAIRMLSKIVLNHIKEHGPEELCDDETWRDEDGNPLRNGEVFPQIRICFDVIDGAPEADNPIVFGGGVMTLAFLLQEDKALRNDNCDQCEIKRDCLYAYMWRNHKVAAYDREYIIEDYLNFLRRKYPDLYIPEYKSIDTGLTWVDLLTFIDEWYDLNLSVGIPQPAGDCPKFKQYEK